MATKAGVPKIVDLHRDGKLNVRREAVSALEAMSKHSKSEIEVMVLGLTRCQYS
jgi:HEAT repeat protein